MAKLVVKHAGIVIREYPLAQATMTIGRHPDNDIQLDDAAVSSQHARLSILPNDYLEGHNDVYIEDLDSTNGTQVNGRPINRHLLKNGDQLLIGKHRLNYISELDHSHEQTAIYIPDP